MDDTPRNGDVLVDIIQESINRLKTIARLREELDARDAALRGARAEIEQLKDKWMTAAGISDANKVAAACFEERLRKARARIAALEKVVEAARPLANAAADLLASTSDRSEIWELPAAMSITAGDLRRLESEIVSLDTAPGDRADPEREGGE